MVRALWIRLLSLLGIQSLEVEVKAHMPVLGVLRGQLTETTAEMERSVVSVCGSFQGIAAAARETVDETTRVVGSGDSSGSGVDQILSTSAATIERLIQRMESNSEISMRAVERMQQVEVALREITRAIADVDNIAFTNRLLALNAKIEAVHVGEAGAGFGVVADEISAQAKRSTEITERITETVKELSVTIVGAAAELRDMAEADRENLAASRRDVGQALHDLGEAHTGMRSVLDDARVKSAKLADDISRAVMHLQFQDRLGQRISHVVTALDNMESALRRSLVSADHACAETMARRGEIVSNLEGSCTMERERAVLAGDAPAGPDQTGDVELF